jgi:uncharacterized membrane protein SirB2
MVLCSLETGDFQFFLHRSIILRQMTGTELSEHYLLIKQLHIMTVVLSITLFTLRFLVLIRSPAWQPRRWLKVLPHVNDSLLLIFAILLCIIIQQAPLISPWLTEKVAAVILYILAGMFALKWSKTRLSKIIWFMIAIFMFAYAANIAINKG